MLSKRYMTVTETDNIRKEKGHSKSLYKRRLKCGNRVYVNTDSFKETIKNELEKRNNI